jgi:hypothetical protein
MSVYDSAPPDPSRCIALVDSYIDNIFMNFKQCSRKRGYGPSGKYCKQHGAIEERRQKWQVKDESKGGGA